MEFLDHQIGGDVITLSRDNLEKVEVGRVIPREGTENSTKKWDPSLDY